MKTAKKAAVDSETDIGPRLRSVRAAKGLSLRAVADRSGVTAAALSLIENGKNSPSVSTLKKVLGALGLTLAGFFAAERPAEVGTGVVTRRQRLVNVATGDGLKYLALPGPHAHRAIQIMHEIYASGADTGPEPYSHAGEEAGFCISGTIEVTVDGRSQVLRPGDAFYFSSTLPHRWRNVGASTARMISACSPPTF